MLKTDTGTFSRISRLLLSSCRASGELEARPCNCLLGDMSVCMYKYVEQDFLTTFASNTHKMAIASDPGTRDRWKWSAYSEVTAQGPSSGFGDDII
eukprot:1141847-Pelagomonas_calceolata.AAC.8